MASNRSICDNGPSEDTKDDTNSSPGAAGNNEETTVQEMPSALHGLLLPGMLGNSYPQINSTSSSTNDSHLLGPPRQPRQASSISSIPSQLQQLELLSRLRSPLLDSSSVYARQAAALGAHLRQHQSLHDQASLQRQLVLLQQQQRISALSQAQSLNDALFPPHQFAATNSSSMVSRLLDDLSTSSRGQQQQQQLERLIRERSLVRGTTQQETTTLPFGGANLSSLLAQQQLMQQNSTLFHPRMHAGSSNTGTTSSSSGGRAGLLSQQQGSPTFSIPPDLAALLHQQQREAEDEGPIALPPGITQPDDSLVIQGERFPQSLYRMLEDAEKHGNETVIGFTASGRAFEIRNPIVFEREIMPRYFPHGRVSSFKRQLNLCKKGRSSVLPSKLLLCYKTLLLETKGQKQTSHYSAFSLCFSFLSSTDGFKILSQGADAGAYAHPDFTKDDKQKSQSIKRQK